MAQIIELTDITAPALDVFARLTEAQLRNKRAPEKGIFIAESPKVIRCALNAGLAPLALLMERRHLSGQGAALIEQCGDIRSTPGTAHCWPSSPDLHYPGAFSAPCAALRR